MRSDKHVSSNLPSQVAGAVTAVAIGLFVFAAPADAASYKLLYAFKGNSSGDGNGPQAAPLINIHGKLYGTTWSGGSGAATGTVFSFDPTTSVETVLHSFSGGSSDGGGPGGVIDVGGELYGTTYGGGTGSCPDSGAGPGCGIVFSLTLGGNEKVLYSFKGGADDGANAGSPLIEVSGALYGTTANNGTVVGSSGTVFSINPTNGHETVLHSFGAANDGSIPQESLINVKGKLYGTTSDGGAYANGINDGTVFSIRPDGSHEKVLHSFGAANDRGYPTSPLIEVDGTLYGTTEVGGTDTCDCGTVFSIDPKTGVTKVVHAFTGAPADGALPVYAGLTYVNGKLFGVTSHGGTGSCPGGSCGTVFSMSLNGAHEKVLYSFKGGSDGMWPEGGLIDVNGTLYGTTYLGGGGSCTNGCGTLFSIAP